MSAVNSGTGLNNSYTYDADGLRLSKTVGSVEHKYVWQGGKLVSEYFGGKELEFFYDESGAPYAFSYKSSAGATPAMYYYVTNLQGDVVNILNASGGIVATYTYNAWGKVLTASGTMAGVNPLRYRGYYYDTDTGLYYLKSRYYDPEICRFINGDGLLSTTDAIGTNLFAYCGNNPVMGVDSNGQAWWHWALGAAVVAGCAIATVVTCGGFAAAVAAVGLVGSGMAAATTASTVAAAAFIGSSLVYGGAALSAALDSDSVQEFNDRGSWGTVAATAGGAVIGSAVGYTMSKSQAPMPTTTGKGTQNPKVRAAVQKGQAMHKQMDYGPGVVKEKTIAPGCRVDGIDFNNRIIYELKPNNPQAIARGMSQLDRYTAAASQQYGGTWTGILKLYD